MKDLNYFKKELNKILDKQLEELEKGVTKSFSEWVDYICKGANRGHLVAKQITKRNAKTGKVYTSTVWVNPDKVNGLKKYHEQDSNNAKIAIGKLKKKIDECKNSQELLNLVLKNKGRFSDEQGYPLPIVEELKDYASKKNDELETPSKRRSIQDIQKENSESYKKKQYYSFGFKEVILSKEKLRKLAQKAKKAEFDNECKIDFNDLYNSVGQYLQKLLTESNDEKKWIKSPFFDNARIRFEGQSYSHFFTDKNGNDRPYDEIVKRAKCLGYVKDILRGRGVKASYSMNEKGQTAFVIMGRADIDGTNTAIKVIIKAKKNKYFYLSLNNFGEIKKAVAPSEEVMTKPSTTQPPIKKANHVPTNGSLPQLIGKPLYKYILQDVLNVNNNDVSKIKTAVAPSEEVMTKPVTRGEVKETNHETLTKDKSRRQTGSIKNINSKVDSVNDNDVSKIKTATPTVAESVLSSSQTDESVKGNTRAGEIEKHIADVFDKYMKDSYTKSVAESTIKKYGKERLEKIAGADLKNADEYKKWLNDKVTELEEKDGEKLSDYTIDSAIWKHCCNVYEKQLAQEKLKSMDANKNIIDVPVNDKDMQEAVSIIGGDVARILSGRDVYGNAKQTLTDKIRRRVRNSPAVARAMLVYIKQEQERTGKKVYTDKHSIWEELPKLNENAKQAQKKGESETKTGVSGNLYEGADGTTVIENKDWGRYQISFPGKPDSETISTLKHNGFRWSPSTKTWVCFNTANGEYSLKRVAEKLGLKKPGEMQKSFTNAYCAAFGVPFFGIV